MRLSIAIEVSDERDVDRRVVAPEPRHRPECFSANFVAQLAAAFLAGSGNQASRRLRSDGAIERYQAASVSISLPSGSTISRKL